MGGGGLREVGVSVNTTNIDQTMPLVVYYRGIKQW